MKFTFSRSLRRNSHIFRQNSYFFMRFFVQICFFPQFSDEMWFFLRFFDEVSRFYNPLTKFTFFAPLWNNTYFFPIICRNSRFCWNPFMKIAFFFQQSLNKIHLSFATIWRNSCFLRVFSKIIWWNLSFFFLLILWQDSRVFIFIYFFFYDFLIKFAF